MKYYNNNTQKAINKALQESQAIWLIELELREGEILEEIQSIFQFVLEDGCTFRTWIKYIDIIKACKKLFEDAVDWQFQLMKKESRNPQNRLKQLSQQNRYLVLIILKVNLLMRSIIGIQLQPVYMKI